MKPELISYPGSPKIYWTLSKLSKISKKESSWSSIEQKEIWVLLITTEKSRKCVSSEMTEVHFWALGRKILEILSDEQQDSAIQAAEKIGQKPTVRANRKRSINSPHNKILQFRKKQAYSKYFIRECKVGHQRFHWWHHLEVQYENWSDLWRNCVCLFAEGFEDGKRCQGTTRSQGGSHKLGWGDQKPTRRTLWQSFKEKYPNSTWKIFHKISLLWCSSKEYTTRPQSISQI